MSTGGSPWDAAHKRALELFHQRNREAQSASPVPVCVGVALAVAGEHGLPDSARAWLTTELLAEAIVHKTLKGLLRGETATEGGLEHLLSREIEVISGTIPAGLKEAMFAQMLKERCAALQGAIYARIEERVKSLRGLRV